MYAVYQTTVSIPEFGARAGDFLVLDPADPDACLTVVRHIPRGIMPVIMSYQDQLELLEMDPPLSSLEPSQLLALAVGFDPQLELSHAGPPSEPWPGPE